MTRSERAVEVPFCLQRIGAAGDILDAGYDANEYGQALADLGRRVTVVDINARTIPHAGWTFVQADLRDTGLPAESFDLIICLSTIEHIGMAAYGLAGEAEPGAPAVLAEFERLLRPDGRLLLTQPVGLHGVTRWAGEGEFFQYSPAAWRDLVSGWGLNELQAYRFDGRDYKPCALDDLNGVPYADWRAGGVVLAELVRPE